MILFKVSFVALHVCGGLYEKELDNKLNKYIIRKIVRDFKSNLSLYCYSSVSYSQMMNTLFN